MTKKEIREKIVLLRLSVTCKRGTVVWAGMLADHCLTLGQEDEASRWSQDAGNLRTEAEELDKEIKQLEQDLISAPEE